MQRACSPIAFAFGTVCDLSPAVRGTAYWRTKKYNSNIQKKNFPLNIYLYIFKKDVMIHVAYYF